MSYRFHADSNHSLNNLRCGYSVRLTIDLRGSGLLPHVTNSNIHKNTTKLNKTLIHIHKGSNHCWMIGSASPAMKRRIWVPVKWVLQNKLKVIMGKGKEVRLGPVEPEK